MLSLEEINTITRALAIAELSVHVQSDWGSDHPDFREKIKQHLKETADSFKNIGSSSISHAAGLGGYAYLPDAQMQVGFDIEKRSRVRPSTVQRICKNTEELLRARLPENLWVAKEAAFKALIGPTQPPVLSDLEVTEWVMHSQDLETYFIDKPEKYGFSIARGAVLTEDEYCFGFFVCKK